MKRDVAIVASNGNQIVFGKRRREHAVAQRRGQRDVLVRIVDRFERRQDVAGLAGLKQRAAAIRSSRHAARLKDARHAFCFALGGAQQDHHVPIGQRRAGEAGVRGVHPFAYGLADQERFTLDRGPLGQIVQVGYAGFGVVVIVFVVRCDFLLQ